MQEAKKAASCSALNTTSRGARTRICPKTFIAAGYLSRALRALTRRDRESRRPSPNSCHRQGRALSTTSVSPIRVVRPLQLHLGHDTSWIGIDTLVNQFGHRPPEDIILRRKMDERATTQEATAALAHDSSARTLRSPERQSL